MSHYRNWSKVKYVKDFDLDGSNIRRYGGGASPAPYQAPPAPPSAAQSAADYAAAQPQIYQTQLEYMPKYAAMSKMINEQMYPQTAGLQENLAGQSLSMMNDKPPDWMKKDWESGMRAQLGENVASPIGADAYSTGLMRFNEDYRSQGRNLALSLAGRQQLVQGPSYAESMGGYNIGQSMANQASMYNAGLGYSANVMSSMNSLAGNNYAAQMGLYSNLGSSFFQSSARYKKNVKLWV